MRRLIAELREFAARQGDEITARVMPRWVALRSKRVQKVFAELRPSRERIQVFVLPPRWELGDWTLASMAPISQGWGWFKSKFYVEGDGDVRSAIRLLRISYLYSLRSRKQ